MAIKLITVEQLDATVDGFASAVTAMDYEQKANLKALAYKDSVEMSDLDTALKTELNDKMTQTRANELVSEKLGGAYVPGGSKTLATLPTPTSSNVGFVYNMTEEFTTTNAFVEGEGKKYPAGTEVGVIEIGDENNKEYKYDVLSGHIDTTKFAAQSSFSIVKAVIDDLEFATDNDITNLINGLNLDTPVVLAPGTYDASGNLLKSWDQLVADGDILTDGTGFRIPSTSQNQFPNVKTVVIKDGVKNIVYGTAGQGSIIDNGELIEFVLPNTVETISDDCFLNFENLESINLPNSLKTIGEHAFDNCKNLKSITIPASIKNINEYAFCGCSNLTNIIIEDGVERIERLSFGNCTSLASITIPNSVTYIAKGMLLNDGAFASCTNLTTIHYSGTATGAPWGATNATVVP